MTAGDGELQEVLKNTISVKAIYGSLNCLKRSLIIPLHEFGHLQSILQLCGPTASSAPAPNLN
jgi:hypothetical protein